MDGCCPPKQPETTGKMCSTSSSYAVYQHIRRWRRSGRSRLSFFAGSRRRRQSPRADPRRSDRSGTFQSSVIKSRQRDVPKEPAASTQPMK
ncbi:uncharacterized, partial [Tachysurus ichikawai]